jgi:CheY-like chemotaxis protein
MFEQSGGHPAIIVVDDERDVLLILHRLLRDLVESCDIITASNGVEALSQLDQRRVALVITDYNMTGMNGLQLAAQVKARAPDTGVVLITAFASPDLQKRASKNSVDYYLPKPFALGTLEEIVQTMIAN